MKEKPNKKPTLEERLKQVCKKLNQNLSDIDATNYLLQGLDLVSKYQDKDNIREEIQTINQELQKYLQGEKSNPFTRRAITKYFADQYGKDNYNPKRDEGEY